jgi:ribosomal-protein-alanine N-acetyltransferase
MKHVGTQEIRTDRLLLRRFRKEDLEPFYSGYSCDPKVHAMINFGPDATKESTERFINDAVSRYDDPRFYLWAMTKDDDVFGFIELRTIDDNTDSAELRFSFGSQWWWNGYSVETAKAVRDFAFNTVGMHRLYAIHHVDNVSTGTVYLKTGFEPEGMLRGAFRNSDGTFSDEKQYSILAEDVEQK